MPSGPPAAAGSVPTPRFRPAWAEVDLDALRHNVRLLRRVSDPAAVWAVVKADAYGHGAPEVAVAAIEAGAAGLAVALAEEGVVLREAGVSAPVLVLSEPPPESFDALVGRGVMPTVSSAEGLAAAAAAARSRGTRLSVHVKVDTGMHRAGVPPEELPALVAAVSAEPALRLEGVWTHLAVADGEGEEDRAFTRAQLTRFDRAVASLGRRPPVLHSANTAGAVAWPESRYDLVRPGIALYGPLPSASVAAALAAATGGQALRPVLSLRARVTAVRELAAGERPSYGRHRPLPAGGRVATVPIGYADGVPRALFDGGGEVLIGGRRWPLAGMVTMDQLVVDCGPRSRVAVGDEVVLIGRQGDQEVTADEWAARVGTISYEVLCSVGPRVPRVHLGAGGGAVPVGPGPPGDADPTDHSFPRPPSHR